MHVCLAKNSDASFPLLIVRIHRPFRHSFIVPEKVGLLQQAVQHGGLAVVNVGNYCNISDFFCSIFCLAHNYYTTICSKNFSIYYIIKET